MQLTQDLIAVATLGELPTLENFRSHIDPAWIEEALQASGTATVRKRRLPADQVVWLVIGMGLMRDRPVMEIVSKLDLALPDARDSLIAPSAIAGARARLGSEPMEYLFKRTAQQWASKSAEAHRWRGLQLFGLDGTTLRVADSDENRKHFGLASGGERGESGYPLVRVVALMTLRSHLILAGQFGPYGTSELAYARELWNEVPGDSLTILDKNYVTPTVLVPLQRDQPNRHWMVRSKKNSKWRVIESLGNKEALVELQVSKEARKNDPSLPETWTARAVAYSYKGRKSGWLLTSLLDPKKYPRKELVALYHERWEIELGYDELKTEMLEREETLRSKTVQGVQQELWGILLAYNLVRLEMEKIADEAEVEPVQISFVAALRLIRDEWIWCALGTPGSIPGKLARLRGKVAFFILPSRRSDRSYPRAVKMKMSNYPRKRRSAPAGASK